MNIIICGLAKGTVKKYKCPYCEFESDDVDNFATGMCWGCVYEEEWEEKDESEGSESEAW